MFGTLKYTALAAWYKLTGTRPYVTIIASGPPGSGKTHFLNRLAEELIGSRGMNLRVYWGLDCENEPEEPIARILKHKSHVLFIERLEGPELTIKLKTATTPMTDALIRRVQFVADQLSTQHREWITGTANSIEMTLTGFVRNPHVPTDDPVPWNDPPLEPVTLKKLKRVSRAGRLWITSRQMQTAWKPLETSGLIHKARGRDSYGGISLYYALTPQGKRALKAATQ